MASASGEAQQQRKRFDGSAVRGLLRQIPTEPPSEILDGFLYLGDADQAMSHECLSSANITHVVNITIDERLTPEPDWAVVNGSPVPGAEGSDGPQKRRRVFFNLQDRDDVQISAVFSISNAFIADAEATQLASGVPSRVFVHCMAGRSRSVTLVLAYLMSSRRLSLREAIDLVKRRRPIACPNIGFLQQLQQYEAELHPGVAPSILPPLFQEALARFGEPIKDSPIKAFQRFQPARGAAVLGSSAEEPDLSCPSLISLVDRACEIVDKWQPGWSGGAIQDVLLQSLEGLRASARGDAVMLLKLLVTGDIFVAVQSKGDGTDGPTERKIANVCDVAALASKDTSLLHAPAVGDCIRTTRLTRHEVSENFRSLQHDADLRDNLRIDIPREAEYFTELETLLIEAGLLELTES